MPFEKYCYDGSRPFVIAECSTDETSLWGDKKAAEETLERIDRAEAFLRSLDFRQVRVRAHGTLARIEVPPREIDRFLDEGMRMRVTEACKQFGFTYVSLDLTGYRTGSMNAGIPREAWRKE